MSVVCEVVSVEAMATAAREPQLLCSSNGGPGVGGNGGGGCRVCASLLGPSVEEMARQMAAAAANGADLVELRLDHLDPSLFHPPTHIPALLCARPIPVIVTYRPKWEGGLYEGEESHRLEALLLAVELGAEYIDVELKVAAKFSASLKEKGNKCCKIIVSYHSYQKSLTADDLGDLVAGIQSAGADIIKIAAIADKITDVAPMLQLLARSKMPTIVLAMGAKGQISRLLCPKFGGYLTFGSLDSGLESAPGQPTLSELKKVYRSGNVSVRTEVFGLISCPVQHSKGPIIHNAAFVEVGFDGIYLPFLVDDLHEFFRVYGEFNFSGFSVGIPHKESVVKFCDELDSSAKTIGAVNTIVRRKTDGKLIGYNTDWDAAISAIEDGLAEKEGTVVSLQEKLVVVIGSGGAGKAIAFGAKQRGARVVVTDYFYEKALALANAVGGKVISLDSLDDFCPESGMILANASPVGMYPNMDRSPIQKRALKSYSLVFDAIYNPGVTKLLQEASECGAAVVSGLEMFIRQATAQFELFTGGHHAPERRMRELISSFYIR